MDKKMKNRLLIIIGIIASLGISIIIIASNLQNYYLFDPNFTDKPSGVSIKGLKEEYRQGEPIEFAIRVHGYSVGCESVTVKIFNEWKAQPSLLYDKGFIAEDKPNLKPSQAYYSCPITFKQFNDGKSGKYLVMINYFQGRGSYGEIKQEFKVMSLPTLSELHVSKVTFENTCTENQICYGNFDNGTKIRISCEDIAVHGCSVKSFENDTGIVPLGNQSYYFETPNYTETAYVNPVQISFHDVIFTLFPSGFRGGLPVGGCGGSYYWTDAMFPDNTHELLHIFVNFSPCVENSIQTMLSNHTNPQAGLFFSDNKMKILVMDSDLVVPRGDLFLQQPLRIEGLNDTYSIGQKIEFTVKFNGTKYDCYTHPTLRIEDSNHQKVWESNTIVELCDPDTIPTHFEKIWDTTNSNLGVPILNKTGTYTLFAEFEKNIIQQDFSVNLIESTSDEISALSYICFNHDLSSNSTGVYLTCHNEEHRNIVYDLPDPVYKREDCKSTYGCASKYVWIPQIPKELISEEYKKQILEKVLNLPETKNWPAKSKLDHFNIGTSVDRWEANIQFFVAGFKLPQHNHCEFYDSVNIDLETMEVTSGFRNFTNFEKC